MNGPEKSDSPIVAMKPANEAARAAEEQVEPRGGIKENAGQQTTDRTQSREAVSHARARIREAVTRNRTQPLTTLLHHVSVDVLRAGFLGLKKTAAPGVDGLTWTQYEDGLEANLQDLHARVHTGAYRALASRRRYIPKADGRRRPLGIAALEDKIVQAAVAAILTPIYEAEFLGFSYGFRPERGQHDALDALAYGLGKRRINWVLDADIRSFLDTASYCPLVHEVRSKSSGSRAIALMRSPFCLPRITWTASSSPRLTRCNTVWRETPSAFIASRIGMKPSPASLLNRAMTSWVNRMRHGAPGVSCSPWMIPALSKRWRVEGATPSTAAAFLMVNSSPSARAALGSKHGISQCRRRLPARPASKRWPYTVVRPWRLRMPAITASG